ncbi:MAG: AraC family transcriptional regulator [Paludibacteraceae bacterium]|nr:AraC family transcriptional regulator [Paludibacteraceae bacterium]MBR6492641.1 AraC family transcriptional regulator [Paludibacteraceae bacterium]
MFSQIIQPSEALRPYITRYVFVRAEGSTDTMTPPSDDPRFINGKHVQPLLPNYGSMVFMRNVTVDFNGVFSDGLTLLGANQQTIGLTTLSGWYDGMLLDFEPGGMYALSGIDLQKLAGKVLTAPESGDPGLMQLDKLFKQASQPQETAQLIDAFFIGHLPRKEDYNYTRLRKVIAACDEAKGNMSAAEMASVACLGERQFLRVFRTYVGIPPKQFIRLRRFHKTLQHMQRNAAIGQPIDLMQIALQHGYYDVSHMAMEFQQMGCVSPSHFRMLGIPLTDDFSVFFG